MKKIIISFLVIFLFLLPVSSVQGKQHSINSILADVIDSYEDPYVYYTYQGMTDLIHELQENHSDIMSVTSLGKTYQGRDIWMVKLSDNVDEEEDEPGILLMGTHHGNEPTSFEVLIYFIKHVAENYEKENTDNDGDGNINEDIIDGFDNDDDELIDEDPSEERVRQVVNNTQIYLIPMVNPDGVNACTRKNCAPNYGPFGFRKKVTSIGVDLNRNYGYRWYSWYLRPWYYLMTSQLRDSRYNYRGERPFSENETMAVKKFVESHKINISLSYHAALECILYPWWNSMRPTRDDPLFIRVGDNISRINKYELRGREYYFGYRGTTGTSEDWLYGRHGILPFCIELSHSTIPNIVLDICKKEVGVDLYVCEIAGSIHTNQRKMLQTHQIPYMDREI